MLPRRFPFHPVWTRAFRSKNITSQYFRLSSGLSESISSQPEHGGGKDPKRHSTDKRMYGSTLGVKFANTSNETAETSKASASDLDHSATESEIAGREPRWEYLSPLEKPAVPSLPGLDNTLATFKVGVPDDWSRLDRFIKRAAPGLPPGLIQRLIRQRKIRVNNTVAIHNRHAVRTGDLVKVPGDLKLGFTRGKRKPPLDDISLSESSLVRSWIIHRDARSIVLNKPAGIPVVPRGPSMISPIVLREEAKKPPNLRRRLGEGQGPLGSDDRRCIQDLLYGIGDGRYWIVHRLDTNVSGALVVARDVGAAGLLCEYFKSRFVQKTYWALVEGWFKEKVGNIQIPIDGKRAYTAYRLIHRVDSRYAWVQLQPRTGRKHQLRIHCAEGLGCPIVGDVRYGWDNSSRWKEMATPVKPVEDTLGREDAALDKLFGGFQVSTGLHLMSRNIKYPVLTEASVGALRRRRSKGEDFSSTAHSHKRMVSVDAPLPSHMKDTWKRLGLDEKWGKVALVEDQ